MKTISPPVTSVDAWPKEITCGNSLCQAKLEYDPEDVSYVNMACMKGEAGEEMEFCVVCPHCGTILDIPEATLPKTLTQSLISARYKPRNR